MTAGPAPSDTARETGIFDLHAHLAFYDDPAAAARKLAAVGVGALCATVTPGEFERAERELAGADNVRVGVGLHPWWLADGRCDEADARHAAELAASMRYVAEVGLDFSHGRDASAALQVSALDAVLDACAGGGHVLSLHA